MFASTEPVSHSNNDGNNSSDNGNNAREHSTANGDDDDGSSDPDESLAHPQSEKWHATLLQYDETRRKQEAAARRLAEQSMQFSPMQNSQSKPAKAAKAAKPKSNLRGKPEAMAVALAASRKSAVKQELESEPGVTMSAEPATPQGTPKSAKSPSSEEKPMKKKRMPTTSRKQMVVPAKQSRFEFEDLLRAPVEPITDVEYENLEALMVQFCRVPLLSEFSRPVAVLHKEVSDDLCCCCC
jgi:hypothetical protein